MPLLERVSEALALGGGTALPRVGEYLDHVVRWNQKMDLTAARSAEELVDLSLADALVLSHHARPSESWVDVGSGAGAPGLVLSLLCPELEVTLVEPRDKRVAFLRSVVGSLSVPRVKVVRGRSDGLPDGAWDTAVARATLPPEAWLREGARLSRRAVWVLLARDQPPSLEGYAVDTDLRYEWPLTGASRRALRFVPARGATGVIDEREPSCEK